MNAILIRLITGQICLHACMTGMRMAAPLLALREGYSEALVGVLLSCFALTQVFLSIPAGRFSDRHGFKHPMMLGVAFASAGTAMAVIWPVFPVLCISALCSGGATGVVIIALQRHVGQAAQDLSELKRAFSWLAIGPAISNFMGPLAAGLLIDHAGFRSAFLLLAVLPLLSWFCVRHVKEMPVPPPSANQKQARVWDLLQEPLLRRLLIVNWFLASCWDIHTFMVPVLGHERSFSASTIGLVLGTFTLAVMGTASRKSRGTRGDWHPEAQTESLGQAPAQGRRRVGRAPGPQVRSREGWQVPPVWQGGDRRAPHRRSGQWHPLHGRCC